jgi:drug/metabolite transporter (DMT)-like permease
VAAIVLVSAGAFATMLAGLQRVGAVRNAIIGVLEPLTVAVLAAAFLDQPITATVAVGGALILVGAVIASVVRTTRIAEPNV